MVGEHLDRRHFNADGMTKLTFTTLKGAKRHLRRGNQSRRNGFSAYRCEVCRLFHLGNRRKDHA